MSYVQNVILAFGLSSEAAEAAVIRTANDLVPHRPGQLVHLNQHLDAYGGPKALEVNIAIAAFNYLDLDGWVAALRLVDWSDMDCWFVQLMVQGQHDYGFGVIRIWDDGRWSPGDSSADSALFEYPARPVTDAPLLRAEDVALVRRAHIGCDYETDEDKALTDLADRLEEILGLVTPLDLARLEAVRDATYFNSGTTNQAKSAKMREVADNVGDLAARLSRLVVEDK